MTKTTQDDRVTALRLQIDQIEKQICGVEQELRCVALMILPARRPPGVTLDQVTASRARLDHQISEMQAELDRLQRELAAC